MSVCNCNYPHLRIIIIVEGPKIINTNPTIRLGYIVKGSIDCFFIKSCMQSISFLRLVVETTSQSSKCEEALALFIVVENGCSVAKPPRKRGPRFSKLHQKPGVTDKITEVLKMGTGVMMILQQVFSCSSSYWSVSWRRWFLSSFPASFLDDDSFCLLLRLVAMIVNRVICFAFLLFLVVPCVALLGLYVMKEKTIAFKENST